MVGKGGNSTILRIQLASLAYVRWPSIQGLTSATEAAISSSSRTLDKPEVSLMISANFLLISTFRVGKFTPNIVTQDVIRLICDTLLVTVVRVNNNNESISEI
ncbi:hypothetical protein BOTCAL_0272g00010 [Botryotinia calthae]|uniref:Uncharacterized protein n=1 Tax=Botryotinia calthae TaxID=38488 RepID=A0A4Y8CY99_9HELO|nr:hypothetical protein BOTCAL_0272g00010 [Botryotinia calthae]